MSPRRFSAVSAFSLSILMLLCFSNRISAAEEHLGPQQISIAADARLESLRIGTLHPREGKKGRYEGMAVLLLADGSEVPLQMKARVREDNGKVGGRHRPLRIRYSLKPLDRKAIPRAVAKVVAEGQTLTLSRLKIKVRGEARRKDKERNFRIRGKDALVGAGITRMLIARYEFDGNAQDSSGGGHHGLVTGFPAYGTEGVHGFPFVKFDGQTHIEVEDSPDLDLMGDWSITYWLRRSSNTDLDFVVSKHKVINDHLGGYAAYHNESQGFIGAVWYTNHRDDQYALTGPYDATAWHHYAVTFDHLSRTIRLSMDGSLVKTQEMQAMLANDYPLFIGAGLNQFDDVTPRATASVGDLRIYRVTLSKTEVEHLSGH